ncbi:MAG: malate dehydrogenase [Desulfurococcales archaeon]|nr:malate dehydrogenase [Desulfurococcales archaeon]
MITIIGAGKVGSSAALFMALEKLDDLMLVDVIDGVPQGQALDISHALSILGINVRIEGSTDFSAMKGSKLVVVTAGFPRKPGMTREELAAKNAGVIADIAEKIKKYAPDAIVMLTTNPLDAMAYLMHKRLGWDRSRVIGFSGVLDSGRLAYYASRKLDVSPSSIVPIVLGMHGQKMLPVPRLSTVGGAPLTNMLDGNSINGIVKETVDAGATITNLRGYSSNYGPGAGLAVMAESILKNQKRVFLASVYLDGEYGVKDVSAGVPVVLGSNGVEKIIELPLTDEEKKGFLESVEAIRANISQIPKEYLS